MKKKALYNSCPECFEKVLWMPYEDRCAKCGYGGKPKTSSTQVTAKTSSWDVWDVVILLVLIIILGVFAALILGC